MPSEFDVQQTVAAVYAESLLQLACERGQEQAVAEEITDLLALWNHDPSFAGLMSSAAVDDDARRESLKRIFSGRLSTLVLNLLLVLNDKRRSIVLPRVCREYLRRLNRRLGRESVYVTSAVPLGDADRRRLKEQLKRLTGREAVLVEKVEPELLGGVRVQAGDRVYDGSVRLRLRELRRALLAAVEKHLLGDISRFVTEGQAHENPG